MISSGILFSNIYYGNFTDDFFYFISERSKSIKDANPYISKDHLRYLTIKSLFESNYLLCSPLPYLSDYIISKFSNEKIYFEIEIGTDFKRPFDLSKVTSSEFKNGMTLLEYFIETTVLGLIEHNPATLNAFSLCNSKDRFDKDSLNNTFILPLVGNLFDSEASASSIYSYLKSLNENDYPSFRLGFLIDKKENKCSLYIAISAQGKDSLFKPIQKTDPFFSSSSINYSEIDIKPDVDIQILALPCMAVTYLFDEIITNGLNKNKELAQLADFWSFNPLNKFWIKLIPEPGNQIGIKFLDKSCTSLSESFYLKRSATKIYFPEYKKRVMSFPYALESQSILRYQFTITSSIELCDVALPNDVYITVAYPYIENGNEIESEMSLNLFLGTMPPMSYSNVSQYNANGYIWWPIFLDENRTRVVADKYIDLGTEFDFLDAFLINNRMMHEHFIFKTDSYWVKSNPQISFNHSSNFDNENASFVELLTFFGVPNDPSFSEMTLRFKPINLLSNSENIPIVIKTEYKTQQKYYGFILKSLDSSVAFKVFRDSALGINASIDEVVKVTVPNSTYIPPIPPIPPTLPEEPISSDIFDPTDDDNIDNSNEIVIRFKSNISPIKYYLTFECYSDSGTSLPSEDKNTINSETDSFVKINNHPVIGRVFYPQKNSSKYFTQAQWPLVYKRGAPFSNSYTLSDGTPHINDANYDSFILSPLSYWSPFSVYPQSNPYDPSVTGLAVDPDVPSYNPLVDHENYTDWDYLNYELIHNKLYGSSLGVVDIRVWIYIGANSTTLGRGYNERYILLILGFLGHIKHIQIDVSKVINNTFVIRINKSVFDSSLKYEEWRNEILWPNNYPYLRHNSNASDFYYIPKTESNLSETTLNDAIQIIYQNE